MRKITCVLAVALALAVAESAGAATTYTGAGIYSPADNCGFSVADGAQHGWVDVMLKNDTTFSSIWTAPGVYNNLRVKEFRLYGGTTGPNAITIDDSEVCGFTRSFNFSTGDFCEVDWNRPGLANPEAVPPGPDLPTNSGFWTSNEGFALQLDILSFGDTDYDYWSTAQTRESEFWPGGVRRCRVVDGSDPFYALAVAP